MNQFRLRAAYGESGVQPGATTSLRTFGPSTVDAQRHRHARLARERAGQPRPQAGDGDGAGDRVRGAGVQQSRELRAHVLQQEDARRADQRCRSPHRRRRRRTTVLTNLGVGAERRRRSECSTTQLVDRRTDRLGRDGRRVAQQQHDRVARQRRDHGSTRTRRSAPARARLGRLPIDAATSCVRTRGPTPTRTASFRRPKCTSTPAWTSPAATSPAARPGVGPERLRSVHPQAAPERVVRLQGRQHVLSDGQMSFICQQYPKSCPEESNPDVELWRQARNVAYRYGTVVNGTTYTTESGYIESGQFWRLREVSANVHAAVDRASRGFARSDANLTFSVRNLHVWTKYTGVDPEANYGSGDEQTDFNTASPADVLHVPSQPPLLTLSRTMRHAEYSRSRSMARSLQRRRWSLLAHGRVRRQGRAARSRAEPGGRSTRPPGRTPPAAADRSAHRRARLSWEELQTGWRRDVLAAWAVCSPTSGSRATHSRSATRPTSGRFRRATRTSAGCVQSRCAAGARLHLRTAIEQMSIKYTRPTCQGRTSARCTLHARRPRRNADPGRELSAKRHSDDEHA